VEDKGKIAVLLGRDAELEAVVFVVGEVEAGDPRLECYTFPAVGRCIYCGSTDLLSEEHIIPYSLSGHYVLPEASCDKCAKTINRFEQFSTRTTYFPLAAALEIKKPTKEEESA
jgi:HNH endonuclease